MTDPRVQEATRAYLSNLAAMRPHARKRLLEQIQRANAAGKAFYEGTPSTSIEKPRKPKRAKVKPRKRRKYASGRDWTVPLW